MNEHNISDGSIVEVIDTGELYPNYDEAARKLKATKWVPNSLVRRGDRGKLLRKIVLRTDVNLCLVDRGEDQILISINGLKLISSPDWDERKN